MARSRAVLKVEDDVITARQAGRDMARQLGLGLADQTRLATAISELARNVIQHAGKGTCFVTDESNQSMIRIQVVVEDRGPGIPDIEKAMEYGFSSTGGLGVGLPGARSLIDEFNIKSRRGHTKVTIAMVKRRVLGLSNLPQVTA